MDSQNRLETPNEKDKRLFRLYGKLPSQEGLLHHQLEGRKYFDSGDFALSQAKKPSNAGAVKTGSQHPFRSKISHPTSPVPSSSNVDNDADRQLPAYKNVGEIKHTSHLHEETVSENGNPQARSEKAKDGKECSDVDVNPSEQREGERREAKNLSQD